MSKIEEVARAIGGDVWESCSDRMKEQFRAQARAAIEAMRTPTEEMERRMAVGGCCSGYVDIGWRNAIDVALAEGQK